MSSKHYFVYVFFRPWDGSPFYVGKGLGRRLSWHEGRGEKHPNRHMANIFQRATALGMEIPKVKIREGLTEAEAFAVEIALIAAIGRGANGPLVNGTDGGEGASGRTGTPETRAKLRAATLGNRRSLGFKHSEETIAKMRERMAQRSPEEKAETNAKLSAAHKGKVLSEAHKLKLSEAHKGKVMTEEHRLAIGEANLGSKRTAETRARMSAAQTGNKHGLGTTKSPEARAKMAAAVKARWETPEGREKLVKSMKRKGQAG